MRAQFNQLSFRKKIGFIFLITNVAVTTLLLAAFMIYNYNFIQKSYIKQFELFSSASEYDLSQSIQNNKPTKTKSLFQKNISSKDIVEMAVFDKKGKPFFSLPHDNALNFNDYTKNKKNVFVKKLHLDDRFAGYLVLMPNQAVIGYNNLILLALGLGLFFSATGLIAALSWYMARAITLPVFKITQTARKIAENKDFKLRAQVETNDEFQVLADAFNLMLNEIEELNHFSELQLQVSQDSLNKVKFLLDTTEHVNKSLEHEALRRIKSQNELKNMQEHLKNIINSMPSMLICVDNNLNITVANNLACDWIGLTHDNLMSQPVLDKVFVLKKYESIVHEALEQNTTRRIEKELCVLDDKDTFFDILMYPLMKKSDSGLVILLEDVTNQVRMQNMMVQTEKMISVGGLAAGMAHEINNPLGGILQSAQNLIRRVDPMNLKNQEEAKALGITIEAVHQYLEIRGILKFVDGIKECGERAAFIVKNMLQFSRKNDNTAFNAADLTKVVDRAISFAENDYDLKKSYDFRKITILKDYQENLPFVPCVASEVEQVLLNLLRNAAQAMHDLGEGHQPSISVKIQADAEFVHIEVADNGPGISEKNFKRVFEPFFTTKEVGVGTGLGLSVSFFIIQSKHGGKMLVKTKEGQGTTFDISLPLVRIETQKSA